MPGGRALALGRDGVQSRHPGHGWFRVRGPGPADPSRPLLERVGRGNETLSPGGNGRESERNCRRAGGDRRGSGRETAERERERRRETETERGREGERESPERESERESPERVKERAREREREKHFVYFAH